MKANNILCEDIFSYSVCSDRSHDDQQLYHPLNHRTKKIYKKKSKKTRNRPSKFAFNSSLWTLDQNKAYMHFLIQNSHFFATNKEQRRKQKINVKMSQFVKTRTPDQCRSHHQKMIKYHENIMMIIEYIQELISKESNQVKIHKDPFVQQIIESSDAKVDMMHDLEEQQGLNFNQEQIWNMVLNECWDQEAKQITPFL